MKQSTIKKILKINRKLYEDKASEWNETRQEIWEKPIIDFIQKIKKDSHILDIGCGNGRLYKEILKINNQKSKINYLGIDSSKNLIKLNQKKYPDAKFKVGDGLNLNYKNKFDYIVCLGVLHHIPTQKLQLKFLNNICQALKKDGMLFLHVWNRWQKRYLSKRTKIQLADLNENEQIIPWKNDKQYARFVYRFTTSELISLIKHATFNNIEVFYADKAGKSTKNRGLYICLIAKK